MAVKFRESEAAERCVDLMHERFFGGRKLESFFWDGVTNYKVLGRRGGSRGRSRLTQVDAPEGTKKDDDEEARLAAFNARLDQGSDTEDYSQSSSSSSSDRDD